MGCSEEPVSAKQFLSWNSLIILPRATVRSTFLDNDFRITFVTQVVSLFLLELANAREKVTIFTTK